MKNLFRSSATRKKAGQFKKLKREFEGLTRDVPSREAKRSVSVIQSGIDEIIKHYQLEKG